MIFPLTKKSLDKRPHLVAFFTQRATLNNTVMEVNADRSRSGGRKINWYRNWRRMTTRMERARR